MKRLLFLSSLFVSQVSAVELASVFSDNMVLQRDQPITVWGTSESDKVQVKFGGESQVVDVEDGKWEVKLKPQPANKKGRTLTVRDREEKKELKNILVGDVFFCAGQSNMEMPITNSKDCAELVKNAANDQVRICSALIAPSSEPQENFPKGINGWRVASPESVAISGVEPKRGFSGTAFSFAYHYQKAADVPVGVFASTWGGVHIHAFSDKKTVDKYRSKIGAGEQKKAKNKPSALYNALVHPLTKMPIAGWVWYQGENDVKIKDYTRRQQLLIESWREIWNDADKPFYMVQICPFNYRGAKVEDFWKQQLAVPKKVDNVHIVRTEDIGNLKDIHPHNKLEVGKRIAKLVAETL